MNGTIVVKSDIIGCRRAPKNICYEGMNGIRRYSMKMSQALKIRLKFLECMEGWLDSDRGPCEGSLSEE